MKKSVPIKAIDFFCGAGGLTQGLLDSGIEVMLGIDNDASVGETYEKNNRVPFLCRDLRKLSFSELAPYVPKKGTPLLFVGCAPCQPFSKINKSQGNKQNEDLLLRFGEFVEYFQPDYLVSENVPQITKRDKVFKQFLSLLDENEYHYDYGFIDAKDVGVAQTRRRLVLLASKRHKIIVPELPKVTRTVRDVIAHFPPIGNGETHARITNHAAMQLSPLNLKRIKATPKDGGDSRSWPRSLKLECHRNTEGYTDVYGRMFWDRPSPTLTTRCNSYSNGRFGHPDQDRAISLREAAALQSFPDNYVFYGNKTTIAKHIGNAVPPLLGKFLGEYIVSLEACLSVEAV
jgi:DNA (cytosine-5)-methyltransferase 1